MTTDVLPAGDVERVRSALAGTNRFADPGAWKHAVVLIARDGRLEVRPLEVARQVLLEQRAPLADELRRTRVPRGHVLVLRVDHAGEPVISVIDLGSPSL